MGTEESKRDPKGKRYTEDEILKEVDGGASIASKELQSTGGKSWSTLHVRVSGSFAARGPSF